MGQGAPRIGELCKLRGMTAAGQVPVPSGVWVHLQPMCSSYWYAQSGQEQGLQGIGRTSSVAHALSSCAEPARDCVCRGGSSRSR
jgi:hypothetical protein